MLLLKNKNTPQAKLLNMQELLSLPMSIFDTWDRHALLNYQKNKIFYDNPSRWGYIVLWQYKNV